MPLHRRHIVVDQILRRLGAIDVRLPLEHCAISEKAFVVAIIPAPRAATFLPEDPINSHHLGRQLGLTNHGGDFAFAGRILSPACS